jgi:hypothetical protein
MRKPWYDAGRVLTFGANESVLGEGADSFLCSAPAKKNAELVIVD